jgi:hypothetical protein
MILLFFISLSVLLIIFNDLKRNSSVCDAVLSPMFYFALLWFLAFPLHAWMLYEGWVDTQQHALLTQRSLKTAVWLSLAILLVVYYGVRSARPSQIEQPTIPNAVGMKLGRILLILSLMIALALYFLMQSVFDKSNFTPFIGNAQNEFRVGRGPLFLLSELFIYGLIAAIPALLASSRRCSLWLLFLLVFATGIVLTLFMGIALNSRRIIVAPLFALALAWLYTSVDIRRFRGALMALLLAGTVLLAPYFQILRYAGTPPTLSEKRIDQVKNIPSYVRLIGGVPTPQKFVVILEANGIERNISGLSARIAMELSDPCNYKAYAFLQNIFSSYGLVDHLATFLDKASSSELLFGVDHGISWSYNMALALVPRAIWKEKPLHYGSVAMQKWLYPDMFKNSAVTMTLPPSFIVDFIYGFGGLSLLALSFGLGRLLAWSHSCLLNGLQPSNQVRFVIGLFLISYMFNIFRCGTGFVQALIPLLVVIVLFYGIKPLQIFASRKR